MTIYPTDTLPRPGGQFLEPKYTQIESIEIPLDPLPDPDDLDPDVVENLLRDLPRGLTNEFQYGLGVPREYVEILRAVEQHTSCTRLALAEDGETHLSDETFVFSLTDFEALRSEFDRIAARGRTAALRVKNAVAHNSIAPALGLAPKTPARGTHPFSKLITDAASGALSDDDQIELVSAAVSDVHHVLRATAQYSSDRRAVGWLSCRMDRAFRPLPPTQQLIIKNHVVCTRDLVSRVLKDPC